MNQINHSVLIVSFASAMLILGASIALGLRFGITPGLLTGVGSFTLLISCMLFANRRLNKQKEKEANAKTKAENPEESEPAEEIKEN